MLKQKHVDASREVRLWLGQIVLPFAAIAAVYMSNEQNRNAIAYRWANAKDKVKSKFNR